MRPIKLKLAGLNSFVEEQIIEFDKLTERGLFGIFGPTGSGKSTILDAITMAMYGDIARNTSEFINTNVDSSSISYEFEVGIGQERNRYIVERNIKRKKEGGYRTSLARIREIKQEVATVICEGDGEVKNKIIEIIGLNADDFTRSVVLPQGKFNEFLKLKGKDRRNMFERLFNLEKYGIKLTSKIRSARNGKLTSLNQLIGELNGYEGVSQEAYDNINNELILLKEEEKNLKGKKKLLDDEYERLNKVWENQKRLDKYLQDKGELDKRLVEIEAKRSQIDLAQRSLNVSPFIDYIKDTNSKISHNREELLKLNELLTILEVQVEITEREYKGALDKKNNIYPILITKESDLKHAIELEKEVVTLQEEINKLKNVYNSNIEVISKHTEESSKKLIEMNLIKDRLDDIGKRVKEISTVSEYRESIEKAAETEKEYKRLEKDKIDGTFKMNSLQEAMISSRFEYDNLTVERNNLISAGSNSSKQLKELISNCPGDNNMLLHKQNETTMLRVKLNTANEDRDKKNELAVELNNTLAGIKEKEIKEDTLKKEIVNSMDSLEKLSKEIESIKLANLAGLLANQVNNGEACPVCGSTHHPKLAAKVEIDELNTKENEYDQLKQNNEHQRSNLHILQGELYRYKKDEEHYRKELEKLNEKLKDINIEELKINLLGSEKLFTVLKNNIENWNKQKTELEADLSAKREEYSKIDSKYAALKEGLRKDDESFNQLKKDISEISMKYEDLEKQYSKLKVELFINNFDEKLNDIRKNEREIQNLQREEKELSDNRGNLQRSKEQIEEELQKLQVKNAQLEVTTKINTQNVNTKKEKIMSLAEMRSPKEYLKEVIQQKDLIIKNEGEFKSKLEKDKEDRQQLNNNRTGIIKNDESLRTLLEQQSQKLEIALEENKLEDIETARKYILPREDILVIKLDIEKFRDDYTFIENNIKSLEKELMGQSINEEKWTEIIEGRQEIAEILDLKGKDIGAKQLSLDNMKKNLEAAKKLSIQKNELQHLLDLLEDLDKLVQGNKFVEFVAMNQLNYIAIEASRRLKDITRGRYALELDSTGNFVIRDDFNGGIRRATDTLSGGETFLASLSLALALSSQIQLKGRSPLEFFFLDEGFGTLDSELLEIVMCSLERLNSDKLCVGIISHVEELRNRVPIKLVVTPAKQGGVGSTVEIEYS